MNHYSYNTHDVCTRQIDFDLDGDKVHNITFKSGCPGNLAALSKLLEGQSVDYIDGMLRGNTCDRNPTSCADQLARAVRDAYEQENSN